jgi:cyanophycinase-like exopeptidase
MSAFAALAEGGDANSARAAAHAIRARVLVASGTQTGGSQSQLIASLVETCADDTLRLTVKTGNQVLSRSRLDGES